MTIWPSTLKDAFEKDHILINFYLVSIGGKHIFDPSSFSLFHIMSLINRRHQFNP